MITGNQMRLLRNLKNISQPGLAIMLGISQQYISRLEKLEDENLPHYWAERIIAALHCNEVEVMSLLAITPPPATINWLKFWLRPHQKIAPNLRTYF